MANVDGAEHTSWIVAAIGTTMATMAGVVSLLWKMNESKNASAIEELRKDRDELKAIAEQYRIEAEELRIKVAVIEQRLADCAGCDHCPLIPQVSQPH
jgi:hypothetical protein